ncbi:hypothetical protein, partial [Mesorhizobium sp. M7D.F.Ca.US.004.03.1.1]|uniref:hypothetical protein n=1 Tax=Mesorhizobium sp. M7D.F.Ca.US.004.03.1.1 TaxID=2496702 RepID=UPI0019CF8BC8
MLLFGILVGLNGAVSLDVEIERSHALVLEQVHHLLDGNGFLQLLDLLADLLQLALCLLHDLLCGFRVLLGHLSDFGIRLRLLKLRSDRLALGLQRFHLLRNIGVGGQVHLR